MSAATAVEKVVASPLFIYAVLGLVGIWVIKTLQGAVGATNDAIGKDVAAIGGAIKGGANAVIDTASGIATGNNATTYGTPYEGTGIFGTLGAVTNDVLGGAPQAFGEWIGEKLSDGNPAGSSSPTNQTTSGNPYGAGTSNIYASAVDGSPTNAQYVASPYAQAPAATTQVITDGSSGTTTTF